MKPARPCNRATQLILEHMEDVDLTRPEYARRMKISRSLLDKLVCGKRSLTWRLAHVLERGSGGSLRAEELMTAVDEPPAKEEGNVDE